MKVSKDEEDVIAQIKKLSAEIDYKREQLLKEGHLFTIRKLKAAIDSLFRERARIIKKLELGDFYPADFLEE